MTTKKRDDKAEAQSNAKSRDNRTKIQKMWALANDASATIGERDVALDMIAKLGAAADAPETLADLDSFFANTMKRFEADIAAIIEGQGVPRRDEDIVKDAAKMAARIKKERDHEEAAKAKAAEREAAKATKATEQQKELNGLIIEAAGLGIKFESKGQGIKFDLQYIKGEIKDANKKREDAAKAKQKAADAITKAKQDAIDAVAGMDETGAAAVAEWKLREAERAAMLDCDKKMEPMQFERNKHMERTESHRVETAKLIAKLMRWFDAFRDALKLGAAPPQGSNWLTAETCWQDVIEHYFPKTEDKPADIRNIITLANRIEARGGSDEAAAAEGEAERERGKKRKAEHDAREKEKSQADLLKRAKVVGVPNTPVTKKEWRDFKKAVEAAESVTVTENNEEHHKGNGSTGPIVDRNESPTEQAERRCIIALGDLTKLQQEAVLRAVASFLNIDLTESAAAAA